MEAFYLGFIFGLVSVLSYMLFARLVLGPNFIVRVLFLTVVSLKIVYLVFLMSLPFYFSMTDWGYVSFLLGYLVVATLFVIVAFMGQYLRGKG